MQGFFFFFFILLCIYFYYRIPVAKTNVSSIPAVGPVKRPGQVQMISKIAVPSSVHYGNEKRKWMKIEIWNWRLERAKILPEKQSYYQLDELKQNCWIALKAAPPSVINFLWERKGKTEQKGRDWALRQWGLTLVCLSQVQRKWYEGWERKVLMRTCNQLSELLHRWAVALSQLLHKKLPVSSIEC